MRSAERGIAGGPSRMTVEHLRPYRGCHTIGKDDSPQQTRWWREGHRDWRCGETIGGRYNGAAVE